VGEAKSCSAHGSETDAETPLSTAVALARKCL
jgi:hypothetical protein